MTRPSQELGCPASPATSTLADMRPTWESLPLRVQDAVEGILGFSVARAQSQRGGFSPGVAARVVGAAGELAFVKAASSEVNPLTPALHRQEARYAALLPDDHPSPRLLGVWDAEPWVALAFEAVDGHEPGQPWLPSDLEAAIAALDRQARVAAVPELPPVVEAMGRQLRGWRRLAKADTALTDWEARHLPELVELETIWAEAAAGDRWLHLDSRGDNLLVRPDGTAVIVDWPYSCTGNPAFDALGFVPAAVRDGAVPGDAGAAAEELFHRFEASAAATPDQVTVMLVAFAGLMQHSMRQPPPPGIPTVREFQRSQGEVALAWLRHRTGWT